MNFEEALKKIKGAESVGGQLIVNRGGKNVLVGKSVQGVLIIEDTAEAKDIISEVDPKGKSLVRDEDDDYDPKSWPPAPAPADPNNPPTVGDYPAEGAENVPTHPLSDEDRTVAERDAGSTGRRSPGVPRQAPFKQPTTESQVQTPPTGTDPNKTASPNTTPPPAEPPKK